MALSLCLEDAVGMRRQGDFEHAAGDALPGTLRQRTGGDRLTAKQIRLGLHTKTLANEFGEDVPCASYGESIPNTFLSVLCSQQTVKTCGSQNHQEQ